MKLFSNIGCKATLAGACLVLAGCGGSKPWPESPLYEPETDPASPAEFASAQDAMEAVEGNYAHYDVVAYAGETPNGPLNTFIVSYGFTRFDIEDGELISRDTFCFSEHKSNQNFTTRFSDEATQAIIPRSAAVDVWLDAEGVQVYRPRTPTLLGMDGDPDQPLPMDKNSPLIRDDDHDGKPGVTVDMRLFGFINAELYIARREIYETYMTLYQDGSLRGDVIDESEQLVIGASLGFLDQPNNPDQYPDPGMNPIILVPVADDFTRCDELKARRNELFPPSPKF
ncbi:MAG: hypothetical protein R3208_19235 [Ketobacteraceae bacterium]|nr:hypothetical protein [Ketobacteraceae bacterium]